MKRNNVLARLGSAALACLLMLRLCCPAFADGDENIIYLNDNADLMALAERCAYDAWSQDKTVVLQRDISLGGVEFLPIASFGGTFEGNSHTISGLSITSSVSPAGLFGTVAATGVVRDLTVEGSVAPGGSANVVGGVAGVNRGRIENCAFTGTVEGERHVGGIVGENAASGVVRRCTVSGGVFGKNMTGGVAGLNRGAVYSSVNRAYVNTNTLDPSIAFDKLDLSLSGGLSSLMSPETYNVTVDSGGVAGFSDGELMGCRNYGSVGYQHIGYNVGGIAGRSSGHVSACTNDGRVYGRREVGGVVGMAEPYIKLNLKENSIEEVRRQLNALSDTINRTVDDAEAGADTISARLTAINNGVDEAETRTRTLTDHITDTYDNTIREVNRGSDILDAVIDRLYDVSGDMAAATGTFTTALDRFEDALGRLGSSGASGELSAMASDLRKAASAFDEGTAKLSDGLRKLDDSVGPTEESELSEAQWRDEVYGVNGLQKLSDGAAKAASGMGKTTTALSAITTALENGTFDAQTVTNSGITGALTEAGSGFSDMADAMVYITDITKFDHALAREGFDSVKSGVDILAKGNGNGSPFSLIASAAGHMSNAVAAAETTVEGFRSSVASFRDASGELTTALRDTESMLDYLRKQEKLQFPTLGEETDAEADALYDSLRGISNNIELLNQETKSASDVVLEDVRQINRQFTALMNTLLDVVEDVEGMTPSAVVEDTSDEDIDAVVNGKVLLCSNTGAVSGDIDVGGVAGSMMFYNELDPENDDDTLSSTFRRRYELKCILQECTNSGAVTGKRDNVGAVCGSATLGVISGCEGYGSAESEGGDYVGGVAGYADNIVRRCWAKSTLSGAQYVGGIVGSGSAESASLRVEGCSSLVDITNSTQYAGAIAGFETGAFSDNRFVSDTLAGIDRVSYQGKAEPVAYDELVAEEGVPQEFRRFTLSFVANGNTIRTTRFNYGDSPDASAFPEIPAVEGQFGRWDREDLSDLRFDTTVTAVYTPRLTALGSSIMRSAARPAFFVEGAFDDTAAFDAVPAIYEFDTGKEGAWRILRSYRRAIEEQWELTLPDDGALTHVVRYLPPEGVSDRLELYERSGDGWTQLETGGMGSYLTFETNARSLELTVVSAATPWWVNALLAVFLLVAAALLAVLLIRKRRKPAAAGEDKALLAARKKKRNKLRLILLIAVLVLGASVAAAVRLAPRVSEGMSVYRLMRNYAERSDLDMALDLDAELGGEAFDADVLLFTTNCEDKRVSCVLWEEIPIYFCDGAMLLENGKAYRADGVPADYSQLLSHAAGLYRAVDVTLTEENDVKTYHAVAAGEDAKRVLSTLLPGTALELPDTAEVGLDLIVTDGELTSLRADYWDGAADRVSATLRMLSDSLDHTLPQAVRGAIASGEYANAEELGDALGQLIAAWTELSMRDPLTADVSLAANCGPLLVDEKLTWQRTRRYEQELSSISRRGMALYFTDDAICTGTGAAIGASDVSFADTRRLLRLAYEAFLLGDASRTEMSDGYRYSVTLDADAMAEFAALIAPDIRSMEFTPAEGTVQLEIRDGVASAILVQCKGSVRVVRLDVSAALSARLTFDRGAAFETPPDAVLEALGLAQ